MFLRAVGEFLREEVRAGTFKGNYRMNLREQMRMRSLRENTDDKRMRVLLVGASQMGRIGAEMCRRHGEKLRIVGRVQMPKEHTVEGHMDVIEEVTRKKEQVDIVLVGGPMNSLVRHGKADERGFSGERQVNMVTTGDGEKECQVTYHMTDPVKIPMTEKAVLVDRMVDMLVEIKRIVAAKVRVMHLTMFPRFVEECCKGHMTDEDVWLFDGIRRDVTREIKDTLCDIDCDIEIIDWWTLIGLRNEPTVTEVRKLGTVDKDNVHLPVRVNRSAAASLFNRLVETGRA